MLVGYSEQQTCQCFFVVFGKARTCNCTGQDYCNKHHLQELRVIPARVIFNWGFKCYHGEQYLTTSPDDIVQCVGSCEYLEYTPVLDVDEANSALYNYLPELA